MARDSLCRKFRCYLHYVRPVTQEKKLTTLAVWLKDKATIRYMIHYLAKENGSSRRKTGLFIGFGAKPLINPHFSLLYDVCLCRFFYGKHAAGSYDDIIEVSF